jgi:hypothetical protein
MTAIGLAETRKRRRKSERGLLTVADNQVDFGVNNGAAYFPTALSVFSGSESTSERRVNAKLWPQLLAIG